MSIKCKQYSLRYEDNQKDIMSRFSFVCSSSSQILPPLSSTPSLSLSSLPFLIPTASLVSLSVFPSLTSIDQTAAWMPYSVLLPVPLSLFFLLSASSSFSFEVLLFLFELSCIEFRLLYLPLSFHARGSVCVSVANE